MDKSNKTRTGILNCIGNTPLVELSNNIVPHGSARIFAKIEGVNPTGSMKDRMALAMIEEAERDGRLKQGDTVVEYSAGSTGTSLAQVCAVKGYSLRIVTSEVFSQDKLDHMRALGAELIMIPSKNGGITKTLFTEMIETARQLSKEPHVYWTDQINNHDMLVGYQKLGIEIWEQTKGQIDAFVHSVGTCGSLRGISTELLKHKSGIKMVAVEPAESPVLSGGQTGSHSIDGIGAGFVVPHWNPNLVSEILTVTTSEAMLWTRKLAEKEAIFAGTSSGGNLVSALRVAKRMPSDSVVVTLFPDTGLKYLSTDLYNNA